MGQNRPIGPNGFHDLTASGNGTSDGCGGGRRPPAPGVGENGIKPIAENDTHFHIAFARAV